MAAHIETVPLSGSKTSALYRLHEGSLTGYSVKEVGIGEYKTVTSKGRKKTTKEPDKE
jgi:HTH-type transcriptional regulator/antitoxin HigA